MRKIRLLAFSFLIFLLSFSFFYSKTYAATEDLSATSSSQQESKINYELPYPGLLPDSPLYFLRIARDRIVGLLISDHLKKAEFNLLQSDKRLNAGIYLLNKGKTSLALSTVSKAQNYFEEAIGKMEEARQEGRDTGAIKENLRNALEKHEQELNFLIEKVNTNFKASFEKEQQRILDSEKRLSH